MFHPLLLLCDPKAGRAVENAAFVTIEHAPGQFALLGFRGRGDAAGWREATGHTHLEVFPVRSEAILDKVAATALARVGCRYLVIGAQPVPPPEPDPLDLQAWLRDRQPWSLPLLDFLAKHEWLTGLEAACAPLNSPDS